MIEVTKKDLENLKQKIPKNHLIIATSNYKGLRYLLGFIAQFIVNPIQRITNAIYDNKKLYIAHVFLIFYRDKKLYVGEMDKKQRWRINPITNSNTFLKLSKGQIRIFDLGKIKNEDLTNFFIHAKIQKYSLLEAISSLKLFRFLNLFISYKDRFQSNKCHCGSIFLKYKPFHKLLKTTGKMFFRKYKTHHPEAVDYYLVNNFNLKIIKVKKEKIQWN